ncbi:MAG: hypothetical protein CTY31_04410 [Hyphomicrobium sp.]|nr:MAG: hypothetical protein CTY31_04410 [Hyphomicrobium sp.]
MSAWPLAFFEFFMVIAFAIGWLILEWYCKRFDKPPESENTNSLETPRAQPDNKTNIDHS